MKNKFDLKATRWRGKPLCVINNYLVRYYQGKIILVDCNGDTAEREVSLPLKMWQKLFIRSRLIERILHIDVRWAVGMNAQEILFLFQNKIFRLDLNKQLLNLEFTLKEGKPLSYLQIRKTEKFSESIVVGDYFSNIDRKEVNIYRRNMGTREWEIVYIFPKQTIRHIHGMVQDTENDCVYILTGDEDSESGIWVTEDDFHTVRQLAVGKQIYRCCQMLGEVDQLMYLTDAPSEQNYICKVENKEVKKIKRIPGSVIYGVKLGDRLIFSTTVEPEAHASNRMEYWLTNKRGKGIWNKNVYIFLLDSTGKCEEIIHHQHDGLPLRLCQYGVANLCSNGENEAYFSMTAVKKEENHIFRVII